jgi:hypothetical protein
MDAVATKTTTRAGYAALTTVLVTAIVLETIEHGFAWQLPVFGCAPDFTLLLGAGSGLAKGQIHPRAVASYNLAHRFWGPLALGVLAIALDLPDGWVVAALAWAAHVALDRTVGYGLRTKDGFQRG